MDVSSLLHYLLPVTPLRKHGLSPVHKAVPGPLYGSATLKEINDYNHERDDQEDVEGSTHGVRGG
jgi:hypothetical protein